MGITRNQQRVGAFKTFGLVNGTYSAERYGRLHLNSLAAQLRVALFRLIETSQLERLMKLASKIYFYTGESLFVSYKSM